MTYGYARVSSKGQERYGTSLTEQTATLKSRGADKVFSEAFTGTKKDRPELTRLMNTVSSGDTVMVCKLDRIARSAKDGIEIIDELLAKGVSIEILNMGKFDNTPIGRMMRTTLFAFAEFERDMIVERTRAGKEASKKNPEWKDGRRRKEVDINVSGSVKDICKELGISRSTYYNRKKEA